MSLYIFYDSTNKNCQAGDIEIVGYGHAKVDAGAPVFSYSVAYDTTNREPLFYEEYSGSINDIFQLEFMLDKAVGYGYKKVGFILDRGYFSRSNIKCLDSHGYSFIIMVKGMNSLVESLIPERKGTFENKCAQYIDEFDVYGTTIKRKMFEGNERALLAKKLRQMKVHMKKHINEAIQFGAGSVIV